jgi:Flp pilus assembly pilin Flp
MKNKFKLNNRGQSLVEYLIIVALMGVATLGVVRLLQETLSKKFAQIVQSLRGKSDGDADISYDAIKEKHIKQKDMSDFIDGSRKNK